MASYLLDTSVLIEWLRNSPKAERLLTTFVDAGDDLVVCCVSLAEVHSGLREEDRERCDALLQVMDYWDVTPDAARLAGDLRYRYARRGVTLSTPDALQAALAIVRDGFFVTGNVKDFPMPELKLLAYKH